MNKTRKKALYESIMKSVAKEVKESIENWRSTPSARQLLDKIHDEQDRNGFYDLIPASSMYVVAAVDHMLDMVAAHAGEIFVEDDYDSEYTGPGGDEILDYAADDLENAASDKEMCEEVGRQLFTIIAKYAAECRDKAYSEMGLK